MPQKNRLLYVDPNPFDTKPNTEDLCINVELRTYERNRSSLTSKKGEIDFLESSQGKKGAITFVTPFSDSEENKNLTTNYTNIHTTFTQDGKGLESQSLGITSIDITFDTSYTPQITINFTDIRGSSLFEAMSYYQDNNGKKPPYSCFYELPYPIFELTIKGFYGRPVVYHLHLLDFKSRFNSSNGNFEFTGKFVGYTYAFLSDMVLGYMRAIVNTDKGRTKFASIAGKEQYQLKGYNDEPAKTKDGKPVQLPTLIDFERMCYEINKEIDTSKSEDEATTKINLIDDKITTITSIKKWVEVYLKEIGVAPFRNSVFIAELPNTRTYPYYHPINSDNSYKTPVPEPNFNKFNENRKMPKKAEEALNEIYKLTDDDPRLASLKPLITQTLNGTDVKLITKEKIVDNEVYVDGFKITLKAPEINTVYVIRTEPLLIELDTLSATFLNEKEETNKEKNLIVDEIISKTFSFEPSIKNIFKIFLAHAETLMATLIDLSEEIESVDNQVSRTTSLNTVGNKEDELPDINHSDKNSKLYPFPEYSVYDPTTDGYKSAWIGSKFPKLAEVDFVKNLITAMIKGEEERKQFLEDLQNLEDSTIKWIPICPLDLPYFRNGVHPYEEISKIADIKEVEIFRYLTQRMFLAAPDREVRPDGVEALTNFPDKDDDYVKLAKKETSNLLSKITDTKKLKILQNSIGDFIVSEIKKNDSGNWYYDFTQINSTNKTVFNAIPINRYVRLNDKITKFSRRDEDRIITDSDIARTSNMFIFETKELKDLHYNQQTPTDKYKELVAETVDETMGIPQIKPDKFIDKIGAKLNAVRRIVEIPENKDISINDKIVEMVKYGIYGEYGAKTGSFPLPPKNYINTEETKKRYCVAGLRYDKQTIMDVTNEKTAMVERVSDLFFLSQEYLNIKNPYKRALVFLSSLQYDSDISDFLDYEFLKTGTITEVPKLYVYLIGAQCYSDKNKSNVDFADVKDFKTTKLIISENLRTIFIEKFTEWVQNKNIWNFNSGTDDEGDGGFISLENTLAGNLLTYKTEPYGEIFVLGNFIETTKTQIENGNLSAYFGFFDFGKETTYGYRYIYHFKEDISNLYLKYLRKTLLIFNNSAYINPSDTRVTSSKGLYTSPAKFSIYSESIGNDAVEEFFKTVKEEINKFIEETDKTQSDTPQNENDELDSDDIKLAMYTTLKSINDKWIGNRNDLTQDWNGYGGHVNFTENLIDRFQFIDRAYNQIGDALLVKPNKIIDVLSLNFNQSLIDILSRILAQNKMNFLALPAFFNYKKITDLEDAFKVYSYNESSKLELYGPSFVCMYSGDGSKHLDLGNDTDFKNDGFDIKPINDSYSIECAAPDFIKEDNGVSFIPAFGVNYGIQNQKMFTNLELNQEQFSESDESLFNTDDISQQGAKRKTFIGQNLFNVWTTRSYEASVEMLGNAQIQPLMYFQLNYIPMYHGVYLIKSVTHSIKPNFMTTKFKGQRMRRWATPLVSTSVAYSNFYGEDGSGSQTPITSSEKNKEALSLTEQAKTDRFLDNLKNPNLTQQVKDVYGDFYNKRENKMPSDMSWEAFYQQLEYIGKKIKTNANYIANAIFVESSFDRFTPNKRSAACGYNQILPSVMFELINKPSLWKNNPNLKIDGQEFLNKTKKHFNNGIIKTLTDTEQKNLNISFFRNIKQIHALYLMELYFLSWNKPIVEIKSPSSLYVMNIAPAYFKDVNKYGNDYILYKSGQKAYNDNIEVAAGGVITANTIANVWANRNDLKKITNM